MTSTGGRIESTQHFLSLMTLLEATSLSSLFYYLRLMAWWSHSREGRKGRTKRKFTWEVKRICSWMTMTTTHQVSKSAMVIEKSQNKFIFYCSRFSFPNPNTLLFEGKCLPYLYSNLYRQQNSLSHSFVVLGTDNFSCFMNFNWECQVIVIECGWRMSV